MAHNHITPTYPWYNPSRISTWRSSGEGEDIARALVKNRPLLVATLCEVESGVFAVEAKVESVVETAVESEAEETLDVIETFLKCDNLRIVAQEGDIESDITIEVELDEIDDLVTEELAEIYLSQGLIVEAKSIYCKLSLLNSEKSVYFAELINEIEQNN